MRPSADGRGEGAGSPFPWPLEEQKKILAAMEEGEGTRRGPRHVGRGNDQRSPTPEAIRQPPQSSGQSGSPRNGSGRAAEDDGEEGEREDKRSHATVLVDLALKAGARLFHDPEQAAYATVPIGNRLETWPLKSKGFKRWLSRLFWLSSEKTPGGQAVADATAVLEGKAIFEAPEQAVYVRLAEHDGAIFLDLANKDWAAVRIDRQGWQIVSDPPVRFRRPRGLGPLPIPEGGGSIKHLRSFVNVGNDADFRLQVGWMLQALRPSGPYPVLCLSGEQGCAKSTMARAIRSLIDPNTAPLRSEPREARDLMIAANNGWTVAFDNLSHLPDWLSDALCRLATGGGFSTRELYTDDEEKIFDAQRPCLLTSIEDLASRGDLLERAIVLQLPRIQEENRRTEHEFWTGFEAVRAKLLGALLTAVSSALASVSQVRLESLPRMADFAVWATAAEVGLQWPAGCFLDAYRGNQRDANDLALDASPLVAPLRQLVDRHGTWEGTAGELLGELNVLAGAEAVKGKDWPKRPHVFSGRLRRLAPNLRQVGILVEFDLRRSCRKRDRMLRVAWQEKATGAASGPSAAPGAPRQQPSDAADAADAVPRDFSNDGVSAWMDGPYAEGH